LPSSPIVSTPLWRDGWPRSPHGPPREGVLEKFAALQLIDIEIPTTDGRQIMLTRHSEPEAELKLLLNKLKLELPAQSSPKIAAAAIRSGLDL
jgi:hypothetical protein